VPEHFSKICGVDAAYSKKDKRVVGTVVLFRDGLINEVRTHKGEFAFPYISGLFCFMKARSLLPPKETRNQTRPDLVCFDAHDLAQPRS
jgi:deoxyinosine 3'endonuclease (endonuclease V)